VQLFHDVAIKETYESMEVVLNAIKYKRHFWHICANFNVVGLLMGCTEDLSNATAFYVYGAAVPQQNTMNSHNGQQRHLGCSIKN